MVDYDKATGSTGIMKIRDTGSTIEFWLYAGSATFDHQMYWSYSTPHGASGQQVYDFQGGAWRFLGSVNVTASGNVNFHIDATGTAGLGGPTDHTVYINRATVPPAPRIDSAVTISSSAVRINFSSLGDGGSPVLEWQITYSTNPNGGVYVASVGSPVDIGGLASGQTWYFWVRGRNAVGWGAFSNRASAYTWRAPDAPLAPTLSNITQKSVYVTFAEPFGGGLGISEYEISYGKTSSASTTVVGSDRSTSIDNLDPGERYYFKARARNSVGWSSWSAISNTYLDAGAYVKVGSVYKRAVPYVRDAGVWKLAKPYAKAAGIWKEAKS